MIQEDVNNYLPVLFVDDDPIAHKIFDKYLHDRSVYHAYSTEEALGIIEKENVPIIITDIFMDEMDGIEFTRRVKKDHSTSQVIVITGVTETINLLNALEAGASDFLLKPVKKADLLGILKTADERINRWKRVMKEIFSLHKELK